MDNEIVEQKKKKYETTTLKKVTKLLFSLSLFSFLFALPLPSLLHSSTLRFHLFNQPIDKNSMFLLCNGLLVFLANYSGLFKTLSTSRRNYDSFKVYDQFGPFMSHPIILEADDKPSVERREIAQENDREVSRDRDDDDDEEENYGGLRASFFAAERAEVEESTRADEEGMNSGGVLSDEELNKKFDEFIKRMKEEIIIVDEAPRTLVVV